MPYELDDEKVLRAVDCLIKDVDKKYDECLVDRFMEFIEHKVGSISSLTGGYTWTITVQPLIDRLKSYTDHRAFVMLNQARALKVYRSLFKNKLFTSDDIEHLSSHLESLWKTIDMLVINGNSTSMALMLSVLTRLSSSGAGLLWLLNKSIEPPIKLNSRRASGREIRDIVSLVRFYMETSNNYHLQNRAETLFNSLIEEAILRELPPTHPLMGVIKQTMHDLMIQGSPSMIHITLNLLTSAENHVELLQERFDFVDMIRRSFFVHLERPRNNFNNICKCLAFVNSSRDIKYIVDKLRMNNHLEAIITYLASSIYKDSGAHQAFLTYTLYPILISCDAEKVEEVEVLINKLLATRDERDFVERNMNDKLVTLGLVQLNQIFSKKTFSLRYLGHFSIRSFHLIVETLICYIVSNYKSQKNHKNVMECCSILKKLDYLHRTSHATIIMKLLNTLRDILNDIDYKESSQAKAIVIELVNLQRIVYRQYTQFLNPVGGGIYVPFNYHPDIVELAFKFEDPDILNEFALLFVQSKFDFNRSVEQVSRYIKLVWTHMFDQEHGRWDDHRELRGNLAYLLIDIDLDADAVLLPQAGIKKNYTIPLAIGDLLINKSEVIPTVEAVIEAIHSRSCRNEEYKFEPSKPVTYGYVCLLDRPILPSHARDALKKLTIGICTAIKSEASEGIRIKAMNMINDLLWEFVVNSDDSQAILKRMLDSRILETIYDICTDDTQPILLQKECSRKVAYIKSNVIQQVAGSHDVIFNYFEKIGMRGDISRSAAEILNRARSIANFFTRPNSTNDSRRAGITSPKCSKEANKDRDLTLDRDSVVDDILNYEKVTGSILECY